MPWMLSNFLLINSVAGGSPAFAEASAGRPTTAYVSGIFHSSGGAFVKLTVKRSCVSETLPVCSRFIFTTGNPGCSVQPVSRKPPKVHSTSPLSWCLSTRAPPCNGEFLPETHHRQENFPASAGMIGLSCTLYHRRRYWLRLRSRPIVESDEWSIAHRLPSLLLWRFRHGDSDPAGIPGAA